jgi:plasmid stability protein
MGKIAVNLPDDLENQIKELAKKRGWSFSDELRRLLYTALGSNPAQEQVAQTTEKAIRAGLTNVQVLEEIRRVHGPTRGSMDTVAYYRSKLRKQDPTVLSDREARMDQY